jgi:Transposase
MHYVGLDASKATTNICVIDEAGATVKKAVVETDPQAIVACLRGEGRYRRIGMEAWSMAPWLYAELARAGLPIICIEAQLTSGVLKARRRNKTDKIDAHGIAEMMRVGLYKTVHVKTVESQSLRALLTARKLLQLKNDRAAVNAAAQRDAAVAAQLRSAQDAQERSESLASKLDGIRQKLTRFEQRFAQLGAAIGHERRQAGYLATVPGAGLTAMDRGLSGDSNSLDLNGLHGDLVAFRGDVVADFQGASSVMKQFEAACRDLSTSDRRAMAACSNLDQMKGALASTGAALTSAFDEAERSFQAALAAANDQRPLIRRLLEGAPQ